MTREVASLLSVFIRNLNNGRRRPYGSKKKKLGFPTKNFGNDEKRRSSPLSASIIPLSLIPECIYCPLFVTPATSEPGSTVFKSIWMPDKRFQARQKRGVIPECLYEGSKLFKDKNIWIPDKRFQA